MVRPSGRSLDRPTVAPYGRQVRIFVSVASYRDAELVPTVLDALAKAQHPERLLIGICWQHGDDEYVTPLLGHP